jgi:ubiquinone/menaquinone biosynthesis C-methylase UbiE
MESPKQIQQYYEEYHRARSRGISLRRVQSNLREFEIQPGDRIIDVGCGLGTTGIYITNQGAKPYGLDLSLEAVRASSTRYSAVLQADAAALPFCDASYDGATLMGTLEHFVAPDRALREVSRTLKKGAQICLVVPNAHFFLFRFFGGTGQPHEEARSYEEWHQLFETQGLVVQAVYRDIGPGISEGGWLRGIVRKLALSLFNLLPLRQTYQFVFVCGRPAEAPTETTLGSA